MAIETRQPEEEQQEQFTFTPHSTTPPPPPVDPAPTPAPTTDWRGLRRQERAARRAERHAAGPSWVGGAILILLGGIFLLQNTGLIGRFDNWWALFILIPAVGSFATAWRLYQQAGQQWTPAATGPLVGGLVLSSLAAMFLFGLNIGMWWPIFLIAGGIATLLGVRQWW
ncbi:MAG: hypothetical protein R3E79_35945 [Caldilineaceae bacterium]